MKLAPVVQSHRGAGDLMPENTLEAFELAWEIGAIPEADVRSTRDGTIVAFHDETLERLAPDADPEIRQMGVDQLDWEVLRRLDVGSYKGAAFAGQRIPQISDVLDAMIGRPKRRIYLDVKNVSLTDMAALVRQRGLDAQVILASTKYEELREWMRLLPRSGTLHWMGGSETDLRRRIGALREAGFAGITQLQIHVHLDRPGVPGPFAPSADFLMGLGQELQGHGILFQALLWGPHEPATIGLLMLLGVESFATDHPSEVLEMMRR